MDLCNLEPNVSFSQVLHADASKYGGEAFCRAGRGPTEDKAASEDAADTC